LIIASPSATYGRSIFDIEPSGKPPPIHKTYPLIKAPSMQLPEIKVNVQQIPWWLIFKNILVKGVPASVVCFFNELIDVINVAVIATLGDYRLVGLVGQGNALCDVFSHGTLLGMINGMEILSTKAFKAK